jgi:hypothetical protein
MKRRDFSTRFRFHLLLSILLGLSCRPATAEGDPGMERQFIAGFAARTRPTEILDTRKFHVDKSSE